MTAEELFEATRRHGATLEIRDGRPYVRPVQSLPEALQKELSGNREVLLAHLRAAKQDLAEGTPVEARERLGAVLIRSRFGELWLCLDPCLYQELILEESDQDHPRPVLTVDDVVRLKGKSETAIRAALRLAAIPGARILQ